MQRHGKEPRETARLALTSTRSDIIVEELDDGTTLTIFARNPLVSWIVLTVGAFVSLWPMTLVAFGLSVSNYVTALVMTGLTATVFWLTWFIGWRPRRFQMRFSHGFLKIGQQRFSYADINSYGLSSHGGEVVDTVSIVVPRNFTIGTHIYIELGKRCVPITVGLKDAQAKEALRLFGQLLDEYRST